MTFQIPSSWKNPLEQEFEKPYFKTLTAFVTKEYESHTCYPNKNDIFNAFEWCDFEDVKVVIIGQDPYHGAGQANGLCFSVKDGVAHPPSLRNIFKELETDIRMPYPTSGNLEPWAKQGILLLNATLTVRAGAAGSHQNKGWETFTNHVIKILSETQKRIVFFTLG